MLGGWKPPVRYLKQNCTFKLEMALDRHNARQKLTYCVLPDPPFFCYHLPLRAK
jgi:hypothetical protein